MSASHMNDVRISARKLDVKRLAKAPAHGLWTIGGPAGDPQVTADRNTIRMWQRSLDAGLLEWNLGMEYRP
eukprot:5240461-Amphidinium_carterae.5